MATTRERGRDETADAPGEPRSERVAGLVAGLLGAGAALLADGAIHLVASAVPFAPLAVGQAVIRAAPGAVDAFFIDRLQHLARPAAVIGAIVGFVAAAAALGLALPAVTRRVGGRVVVAASLLSAPLYVFAVVTYPGEAGSVARGTHALVLVPVFALAVWASARVFSRLITSPEGREPEPLRRTLLLAAGMGGLGVLVGWGAAGRVFRRPNPGRLRLQAPHVTRASTPPEDATDRAVDGVSGLAPDVTPNDRFYVVNEELVYPDIDPDTWSLRIGGLVDRPFALRYPELLAMPAVEQFQTLECISNQVGGRLISNARWTGVPLVHLLERAGVRPAALEVVSRSVDGYADSVPLADARRPTTLIAIGMNRMVLPREHGFPARLLVPGYYGMKQPKWLGEIEVVDRPFQGYWEERGWIKDAVVKTMSRIDTPDAGSSVGRSLVVAGVAFAGDRGISRVQVSIDGGATWGHAQLERALSAFTWRRWRFASGVVGAGETTILVRAIDGRGRVQTSAVTPPEYSGSTGYHEVVVEPQG